MSFIFLSHSTQDDAEANAVYAWLQKEGHKAVFLEHDGHGGIAGGEHWDERLYTELRRCRALIALISPAWLASPWCIAEINHAQALRKPIFPLLLRPIATSQRLDGAPPALQRVQSIAWDGSDEAQDRLRQGLVTAGLDPKSSFYLMKDRPPYPGLPAFQEKDAAIYFGREQEVTDLLALLRECRAPKRPRLVVVQGASGTGKSSLLSAGVLPQLKRDPENWRVVTPFRPGRDAVQGLLAALRIEFDDKDPFTPPALKADDPLAIAAFAKWLTGATDAIRQRAGQLDATVLISVDQLEQALVSSNKTGDAFLLALLEALAVADHRLLVVATIRADFSGTLQRHAALRDPAAATGEIVATGSFQLGPLPRSAFHSIITEPARLVGLDLEPALVSRMVDDAKTDDALPLLAFVLRELWDRYGQKDLKLTQAQYNEFGLEGAVGRRADQIIASIKPGKAAIDALLTTLVFHMSHVAADGRVVLQRLPLTRIPEQARRLLDEFVQARLLVVDETEIEVAHEALFRRWEPLSGRIEEAREELGVRRRAAEAARAWDGAGRPRGTLWHPPDLDLLDRYNTHNPDTFDELQADFLHASKRQQNVTYWLTRAAVGLIAVLAVVAAGFAWESREQTKLANAQTELLKQQQKVATTERNKALESAALLLAGRSELELKKGDAMSALLIAVEALRDVPSDAPKELTKPAVDAAISAYNQLREVRIFPKVTKLAFSADETSAVLTDDSGISVRSIATGRVLWSKQLESNDLLDLLYVWPAEPNLLRLVQHDGKIETLSLADGSLLQSLTFRASAQIECEIVNHRFRAVLNADRSISILDLNDLSIRSLTPPAASLRQKRGPPPPAQATGCAIDPRESQTAIRIDYENEKHSFWLVTKGAQSLTWRQMPEFEKSDFALHPSRPVLAGLFDTGKDATYELKVKDLTSGRMYPPRGFQTRGATDLTFSTEGGFLAFVNGNESVSIFGADGKDLEWPNVQDLRDLADGEGNIRTLDIPGVNYSKGDDYGPQLLPAAPSSSHDKDGILFGFQKGVFFKAYRTPETPQRIQVLGASIFAFPVEENIGEVATGATGRVLGTTVDRDAVVWTSSSSRPLPDARWGELKLDPQDDDRSRVLKAACAVLTRGLTDTQREEHRLPKGAPRGKDDAKLPPPPCGP